MTDRAQHVLDAIDGALEDWSVSGDAMRWTPEPVGIAPAHALVGGRQYGGLVYDETLYEETCRRRLPGFRGGRIPPPPQNGRGCFLPGGAGTTWFISDETHVWADRSEETTDLVQRYRSAIQDMVEAIARLFDTVDVAAIQVTLNELLGVDDDQDETVAEEPRARALRLRRERDTGPSRDLVHQRRPRRLS